jgi:hypothetical protein
MPLANAEFLSARWAEIMGARTTAIFELAAAGSAEK